LSCALESHKRPARRVSNRETLGYNSQVLIHQPGCWAIELSVWQGELVDPHENLFESTLNCAGINGNLSTKNTEFVTKIPETVGGISDVQHSLKSVP